MHDSTTITEPLNGWTLQQGLGQFPSLRAPEWAWGKLADGIAAQDAAAILTAAALIVASDWHAGPRADYDCETDGSRAWFVLPDQTSVNLSRISISRVEVTISSPHDDADYLADKFLGHSNTLLDWDRQRLRRQFIWLLFSRVNPAYAPRRRAATAAKWAAVAAHVCAYLGKVRGWHELIAWACGELLDAASWIKRPPGYESLGYGSLRRQAQDAGGVEGQALMELARVVLALSKVGAGTVSDADWQAWTTLFPGTASLVDCEPSDTRLRRIVEAEWELDYDPPAEEQEPAEPTAATA